MNKRLVLLSCFLLVSVAAYAQYPYKWQIGGTMGMGGTIYTDGGDPTMSMTIGFNKAVQNTKWRWSIEAGIMNQGIVDYFFEDDAPDIFVRPNFEYVGVIADYSLFSKGEGFNIFARGGFAPAHQRDLYVYQQRRDSFRRNIGGYQKAERHYLEFLPSMESFQSHSASLQS